MFNPLFRHVYYYRLTAHHQCLRDSLRYLLGSKPSLKKNGKMVHTSIMVMIQFRFVSFKRLKWSEKKGL